MGYSGFSKLSSSDDVVEVGRSARVNTRPSRRPFTPFELGLITTLILFAAALAAYTVIYIVHHRGAIKPAAVAALSCVALLLLAIAYSVYQRIRRPNWFRDVESAAGNGNINKWMISAPLPMSETNLSEATFKSKATYTSLSSSRLEKKSTHTSPPTATQEKKSARRLLFWTSSKSKNLNDDHQNLSSITSSTRSSTDDDDDSGLPTLWHSIFELPAAQDETQPTPTPELPASEVPVAVPVATLPVQIIVTKPEPAAFQSLRRGRSQSTPSLPRSRIADPLRSNPFRVQVQPEQAQGGLKRDPSVRLIKSSHALLAAASASDVKVVVVPPSSTPMPRRPRSADPGVDRARARVGSGLGDNLGPVSALSVVRLESGDRGARVEQKVSRDVKVQVRTQTRSRSRSPQQQKGQQQQQSAPRGLRRAKSPAAADVADARNGGAGDLRTAYQVGPCL